MFNLVAHYRYLLPNMYFMWQISPIQTFLCVFVGPGLVSPGFIMSRASYPAGPTMYYSIEPLYTAIYPKRGGHFVYS